MESKNTGGDSSAKMIKKKKTNTSHSLYVLSVCIS